MFLIIQIALGISLGFLILRYFEELIGIVLLAFLVLLIPTAIYIFIEFVPANFKSDIYVVLGVVLGITLVLSLIRVLDEAYSPFLKKYFARIWANLSQRVKALLLSF